LDEAQTKPWLVDEAGNAKRVRGRLFTEYGIVIQEIDVKTAEASDPTIKALLREAGNANQMIAMKKDKASADIESEVTKLDADIEYCKAQLDTVVAQNRAYEQKRRAEVEIAVEKLKSETKSKVTKLELTKSSIDQELSSISDVISLLAGEHGERYLELMNIKNASSVKNVTVVPKVDGLKLTV